MELTKLHLTNKQSFVQAYLTGEASVASAFPYRFDDASLQKRAASLQNSRHERSQLAEVIRSYMEPLGVGEKVEESLQQLADPCSSVVIGGQQAGVLLGPLYTLHKLISIVRLAKEQSEKLHIPVVPVFWIAGEDHDFDEVNHLFFHEASRWEKRGYPKRILSKQMVHDTPIEHQEMESYIHRVCRALGETPHTKAIQRRLLTSLQEGDTWTTYFAKLVHFFFQEEGLLLIDASDRNLRKLEKPFFQELLHRSRDISENLQKRQRTLQSSHFSPLIQTESDCAHLFVQEEGERALLYHTEEVGVFRTKSGGTYTIAQLEQMLEEEEVFPLSNNVVTRPLMQEHVFPTLAFIAGPGEIAYWGELTDLFTTFRLEMPIVMPRLSITLETGHMANARKKLNLSIENCFGDGLMEKQQELQKAFAPQSVHDTITTLQAHIQQQHKAIQHLVSEYDRGLNLFTEKNELLLQVQLEKLHKEVRKSTLRKHGTTFNRMEQVVAGFQPQGGYQERTWNLLPFVNEYGLQLIQDLISQPYSFDGSHTVVHLADK